MSSPEIAEHLPKPGEETTFRQCKLNFDDRQANDSVYLLNKELVALRRSDPIINGKERNSLDGAVYGQHAFVMRYFGQEDANDRLLIINLDRDLAVSPAPIPLLAPPSGRRWQVIFSSEDPRYAGQGAPPVHFDDQLRMPGFSATVFAS